jgi:hypothetical protein
MTGFLGIWSDVAAQDETDYLHWLTREHTEERLGVPGFLNVRVFRARSAAHRRYFILYGLAGPDVVASGPYLARLNAPTPWSQRIMPILKNFVRGGGRVVAAAGKGQGAMVLPVIYQDPTAARALLVRLAGLDRVAAVRLFETDQAGTTITTNEKAMRSNDASFPALLLIEALDDAGLDAAQAMLPGAETRYDQVFALTRDDLAGRTSHA